MSVQGPGTETQQRVLSKEHLVKSTHPQGHLPRRNPSKPRNSREASLAQSAPSPVLPSGAANEEVTEQWPPGEGASGSGTFTEHLLGMFQALRLVLRTQGRPKQDLASSRLGGLGHVTRL